MNVPSRSKDYTASDVADPTVILAKHDGAFIERWADRKKLSSPLPIPERPRRKLKSGAIVDASFIERARRLYAGPLPLKMVVRELGCSERLVRNLREEQNWPRRFPLSKKPGRKTVEIKVHIAERLLSDVDNYVFGRFRNRSSYIRKLIRQDLGR